jgi:hypothetical protein
MKTPTIAAKQLMNYYFLIVSALLLVVSCSPGVEKAPKKPEVTAYIRRQGVYVSASDKAAALKMLTDSYPKIVAFMEENDMPPADYYFVDGEFRVSQDAKYMMIPVRHYSSIEQEMRSGRDVSEAIRKHELSSQENPTGKDGYFLLEFPSNDVSGFQAW